MSSNPQRSILIVDDEPHLRELLSMEFELQGWRTISAANGHEALTLAECNHLDVVLSDVRMPDGNGVELLDMLKKRFPQLPVLLMTGYSDLSREQALQRGAAGLVTKPFDPDALSQLVNSLA